MSKPGFARVVTPLITRAGTRFCEVYWHQADRLDINLHTPLGFVTFRNVTPNEREFFYRNF